MPVVMNVSMQIQSNLWPIAQPVLDLLQVQQFVFRIVFSVWKTDRVVVDQNKPCICRLLLYVFVCGLQRFTSDTARSTVPWCWYCAVPTNQVPILIQSTGVNFLLPKKLPK